jgi:hypothetical protein
VTRSSDEKGGWRAAQPGRRTIRLIFDARHLVRAGLNGILSARWKCAERIS